MEISILIDPKMLSNPDAGIRYTLPDAVELLSNGEVSGQGYDYDTEDKMIIYMNAETSTLEEIKEYIHKACKDLGIENESYKINELA